MSNSVGNEQGIWTSGTSMEDILLEVKSGNAEGSFRNEPVDFFV